MRYRIRHGIQKQTKARKLLVAIPVFGVLLGGYLLINTLSPEMKIFQGQTDVVAKKLMAEKPTVAENRLYIPQINVDVATVEINGDETTALEKGAIHRSPSSGNPKNGGNYVLAAHRFNLGLTPDQTRAKSPFYHIDKLQIGDQLYVDYEGTRYAYEVTEKKKVPENAIEIEARTIDPQLTMYSCQLSGPVAGREVVIAKPIGIVTWENGKPQIQKDTI